MAFLQYAAAWGRAILLARLKASSIKRHSCCTKSKRHHSSAAAWYTQIAHVDSRVQIYTSRCHDPYLNLAAEHFLLQHSHPDSTLLILYSNDPCVVIGRNQNPWLEANLALLHTFSAIPSRVSLVRRRSGGGTVFHDRGNVNYSVICPPAAFHRRKHAEMVNRALHRLGISSARVNDRQDIVVMAAAPSAEGLQQPFCKVSGSAYKLTRFRSLHHGTCLLSSPNLPHIGRLLRSPAQPYIKARGVESVRSQICNVGLPVEDFAAAVRAEFVKLYGRADVEAVIGDTGGSGEKFFAHEPIQKGCQELMSPDWIYDQTPLFTFSTHSSQDDPRERPPLPPDVPKNIQEADIQGVDCGALQGVSLHAISDWGQMAACVPVGRWFNHLFGAGHSDRQNE